MFLSTQLWESSPARSPYSLTRLFVPLILDYIFCGILKGSPFILLSSGTFWIEAAIHFLEMLMEVSRVHFQVDVIYSFERSRLRSKSDRYEDTRIGSGTWAVSEVMPRGSLFHNISFFQFFMLCNNINFEPLLSPHFFNFSHLFFLFSTSGSPIEELVLPGSPFFTTDFLHPKHPVWSHRRFDCLAWSSGSREDSVSTPRRSRN